MDFSDDKLLQGRTFSYSDTQRYRVGPNYLQLPINRPKNTVATNQRDGQMTYRVDGDAPNVNPHVNYEPSAKGSPVESTASGPQHMPFVQGHVVRQSISRENNYGQAGDRYRAFSDWERNELIANLVGLLTPCDADVQQRMIGHLTECDADYGRRVAEGLAAVGSASAGASAKKTSNGAPKSAHGAVPAVVR